MKIQATGRVQSTINRFRCDQIAKATRELIVAFCITSAMDISFTPSKIKVEEDAVMLDEDFNRLVITPVFQPRDRDRDLIEEKVEYSLTEPSSIESKNDETTTRAFKRSAELYTIEGSPINPGRSNNKRLDLHRTPVFSPNALKSIKESPQKEYDKYINLTNCVAILSSVDDSTAHDTGDNQENALRTQLLCGINGCLRRPELDNKCHILDCDSSSSPYRKVAPLADLLR